MRRLALFLVLLSSEVFAAPPTYDSGNGGTGANMAPTVTWTIGGSANYALVCLSQPNSGSTLTVPQLNGVTMTVLSGPTQNAGTNPNRLWMLGLSNPATGSVTFTGTTTSNNWRISGTSYVGVVSATGVATPTQGASDSPAISVTSDTNSLVAYCLGYRAAVISAYTADTGETIRASGTTTASGADIITEAGAATTTLSGSMTALSTPDWIVMGVSLSATATAARRSVGGGMQ